MTKYTTKPPCAGKEWAVSRTKNDSPKEHPVRQEMSYVSKTRVIPQDSTLCRQEMSYVSKTRVIH